MHGAAAPNNARLSAKSTAEGGLPAWPALDSAQKRDALAEAWPTRLTNGIGGAAIIALATAAAAYRSNAFELHTVLSLALFVAFSAAFLLLRGRRMPAPLLAPLSLAVIALTQINLMVCLLTPAVAGSPTDPALVVLALMIGTLWALRIDLSPEGFAWTSVITGAILWMPWVVRTQAAPEFALAAAACIAASLHSRGFAADRLYEAYRSRVVWPQMWRDNLQSAVVRELQSLGSNISAIEPAPARSEAAVVSSLKGLAHSLDAFTTNRPGIVTESEATANQPAK